MIRLLAPEALLLVAVVLLALRRRFLHGNALVVALRGMVLLALAVLLARPYRRGAEEGRDFLLVADLSRSVPPETLARVEEICGTLGGAAQRGDRIGMVVFGRGAAIEWLPESGARYRPPIRTVDREGSDLGNAIETALALVPGGRQGSLVLFSDGESTGGDPLVAAREALRRGIRIDAYPARRPGGEAVAVEEVALPGVVAAGEPFRFSAWIRAEQPGEVPVRLLRDGAVVAEGTRLLRQGLNRIVLRDLLALPGLHTYEVEVPDVADRTPENNRARGVVRVEGAFRLLAITPRGREDRLTKSLGAAGLDITVVGPERAPLAPDALDGFRAVLLENVPAQDLPAGSMAALASFVRDAGGGLLLTGGRASFGPGGYHKTPVEEVLPVSMEIRQEQRKFALAMAIALDRSGSMAVMVPSGQTKMDLANLGAVAAVELLGRIDSVAVLAVDSEAHTVVPLTSAEGKGGIISRVRTIESMGGGIYVGEALHAAARELAGATQANKHIVLFADAADSEEPDDYATFVPKLVKAGVTVSVIGLGTDSDSDAALLTHIATLGGGRIFFTQDPADLPRLFAQETIQVARSSIVEARTELTLYPDIVAIGDLQHLDCPPVDGYSIAYAKPGAATALETRDDQKAPLLAFWQCGLGRSAALLCEVDGDLSGEWATWQGYGGLVSTLARWLAGTEAGGELFASLRREGHEALLTVEVEEGREALLAGLEAVVLGPGGEAVRAPLVRIGERRLRARVPLTSTGSYRPTIRTADGALLRVPPVTLPYSPEFEPRRDPREGEKTLQRITGITGGAMEPTLAQLVAGDRTGRGVVPLATPFALAALLLLLLEIAVRRLDLRPARLRLPKLPRLSRFWRAAAPVPPGPADLSGGDSASLRPSEPIAREAGDGLPPGPTGSSGGDSASLRPPGPPRPPPPHGQAGLRGLLDRAKEKSRRKR